jgi:transcriptional regulator with XRE-family HTH domain
MSEHESENFGDRLARLRKESGLDLYEVAFSTGVLEDAILDWESGKDLPEWEDVYRLSQSLGVTHQDILLGDRESPDEISIHCLCVAISLLSFGGDESWLKFTASDKAKLIYSTYKNVLSELGSIKARRG